MTFCAPARTLRIAGGDLGLIRRPVHPSRLNRRLHVRGVNINVPTDSLSEAFATMRKWLDQNGCHPYKFMQKRDGNSVRLFFDFNDNEEGIRFKEAFYGNPLWQGDNMLLRPELKWTIDFYGKSEKIEISTNPTTQVSWCRFMAKQVRTVSDGFNSPGARETLRKIAETWDRLAEHSERMCAAAF
jgi:hypothetical protein